MALPLAWRCTQALALALALALTRTLALALTRTLTLALNPQVPIPEIAVLKSRSNPSPSPHSNPNLGCIDAETQPTAAPPVPAVSPPHASNTRCFPSSGAQLSSLLGGPASLALSLFLSLPLLLT